MTTYTAKSSLNTYSCPLATSNDYCILHCNEEKQTGLTFDCGNSGYCTFNCERQQCLSKGTLNAVNTAHDLTVISSAKECLKTATVNAPNYGNATLYMTGEKSFKELTVNDGTNTQNIIIDCTFGTGDECKGMTVNAADAQYLEVIVGANSEYEGDEKTGTAVQINCPQNSSYSGPQPASCIIDLSEGGTLNLVNITSANGIGDDLWIETGPNTVLSGVSVTCDDGASVNNGNEIPQATDCYQTTTPSISPSSSPITSVPSVSPSSLNTPSPTKPPSTAAPTDNPSITPTIFPTETPTVIPTLSPIVLGTPTKSPITKNPTISPTIAPTTTAQPTTKSPTTTQPTIAPTSATFGACDNLCPVSGTTHNCEVNMDPIVSIPCTDARNECAAKCLIEDGLLQAKTDNPTYAPIIDGISIEDAFVDYCQTGQCIDYIPTSTPSFAPTAKPSKSPSFTPSAKPSEAPIRPGDPTKAPSHPTEQPTNIPSISPSVSPSKPPSTSPITYSPTTHSPSVSPTIYNECASQCSNEQNVHKCEVTIEAIDVSVPCTDARNECVAKCLIQSELETAKITHPNYAIIIDGINIDTAFDDYCEMGSCITTSNPTYFNVNSSLVPTLDTNNFNTTIDASEDSLGIGSKSNDSALAVSLVFVFVSVIFLAVAFILFLKKRSEQKPNKDKFAEYNAADANIDKADMSEDTPSQDKEGLVETIPINDGELLFHREYYSEAQKAEMETNARAAEVELINFDLLSEEEKTEMQRVKKYEARKKKRRKEENLKKEKLELWLKEMQEAEVIEKAKLNQKLQPLRFANCISTVDGCCYCFWVIVILIVLFGIYVLVFPLCLSFNFSDFKVINSEISINNYQKILSSDTSYDSLGNGLALSSESNRRRLKRTVSGYTIYTSTEYYYRAIAADALTVFYYSKHTNNILTAELLGQIHEIEMGIKQFEGYSNHSLIYEETDSSIKNAIVGKNKPLYLESPPGSFMNFVYPQILLGNYVFNGNGDKLTLQSGTLRETIRTYEDLVSDFFDSSFDIYNVSSKYLAAIYPFGYSNGQESSLDLFNWVASYKTQYFDKINTYDIGIAVTDSRGIILQNELYIYLEKDLNLAIASLVIIYVVLYLYCRSFYITTLGLIGVCLSFIPSFALYHMIWGESFNLMNMVAIWVILGIGCDDICVFISSYRRAPLQLEDGTVTPNYLRLAFAYREAGTAMFVTSLTTSCSFFSLCFSTINPLPQFGWFLGSLVIVNFVMIMTWFPCILQSYVFWVEMGIKYNYHITKCTKWLAVSITNYDDWSPETGQKKPELNRRRSVQKSLINKLDRKRKHSYVDNNHSFFGDGTTLYFIIMKKGLGLTLILILLIMTVMFTYTATLITLAQETAELLPDNTNWGQLNIASSKMDIDESKYGGYSSSTGSTSSGIVVVNTPRPTKSPTDPTPEPTKRPTILTTLSPTQKPTQKPTLTPTLMTISPTHRPTKTPSIAPTHLTTLDPTFAPTMMTLNPSNIPTYAPTNRPTFTIPNAPSYRCINDGYTINCNVDTFMDASGDITTLRPSQIAFVFEGGGLYNDMYYNQSIIDCQYYNNVSQYYDEDTYISDQGYDVKWCFIAKHPIPMDTVKFEMYAPFAPQLMSTEWYTLSLWLYYNNEWNQILNKKNNYFYNYSIYGFEEGNDNGQSQYLDIDESVTIYLLFGTKTVTEFSTDCEGEVTSGELIYDNGFDMYSYDAQLRWLQLCQELSAITDNVMYRTDADQQPCFAQIFNEYLHNSSYGPRQTMPNNETVNKELFNKYLVQFIHQPTSVSFSDILPASDPRKFQGWFGTKTSEKWYNSNASIAWLSQSVSTQINKQWSGPAMYEYFLKWDKFIHDFNANSPQSFKSGIQTSSVYVRMEVEVAFIDGFIKSVAYTIILCSIVMVFFTQNLYLVFIVCLYILIICIWVIGIFGLFEWPFGIIEIISVPTVVGLTIDYALHITHAYIHSPFPDRLRRAQSAVNDIGSSVLTAAMTTIWSMFILYFATIIIFSDLGFVVGSTTAFGVCLALFVCPSCLMYTGPEYDQCHFMQLFCRNSDQNGISIRGHKFCANRWHNYKQNKGKNNKMTTEEMELEVRKQIVMNKLSTNVSDDIREIILSDTDLVLSSANDMNGNGASDSETESDNELPNENEYFEDANVENELVQKIEETQKQVLINNQSKDTRQSEESGVKDSESGNNESESESQTFEDEYYDIDEDEALQSPTSNDFVD